MTIGITHLLFLEHRACKHGFRRAPLNRVANNNFHNAIEMYNNYFALLL